MWIAVLVAGNIWQPWAAPLVATCGADCVAQPLIGPCSWLLRPGSRLAHGKPWRQLTAGGPLCTHQLETRWLRFINLATIELMSGQLEVVIAMMVQTARVQPSNKTKKTLNNPSAGYLIMIVTINDG